MNPFWLLKPVPVFITIFFLFSFTAQSGHVDQNQFRTSAKQINDSTGFDTITVDITKNMSIDDVLSMNTTTDRKFAFAQMKNGKKYVITIPEDLRNRSDTMHNSYRKDDSIAGRSNIDTVKIDGRSLMGVGIESEFPGGIRAWYRYMGQTLVYPDEAVKKNIQGQVITKFCIDKNGKVCDINAVSGPETLKKAATNMIAKSPMWIPATLNGFNVKSYKSQPVNFRLESQ